MNKALTFLTVVICTLVAVCVVQWRKLEHQRQLAASQRTEADARSQQMQALEADRDQSGVKQEELRVQAEALGALLKSRSAPAAQSVQGASGSAPSSANPSDGSKPSEGFGGLLSKMMRDPAMRNLIRDQQRGMLEQMYSPLIKQMGLTPEETVSFKELLSENMLQSAESAASLFGATNRTQAAGDLAATQKAFDEQVKGWLGPDRYAQYQEYQQTVGDRSQLNLFNQQSGSGLALNDQQTEALLTYMKEEKARTMSSMNQTMPGAGQNPADIQAMLSPEQAEKLLQNQEMVNQQVYLRAQTILSPDQMSAFGRFQTNQLQMMRMGMSMARTLFAPNDSTAGPGH